MKKLITIILAVAALSCTDGRFAKFQAYGGGATIECYSGGKLIYKGSSTGNEKP